MNDKIWVSFSCTTYLTDTFCTPPRYKKNYHMQMPSAIYLALLQGGKNAIINYIESNFRYGCSGDYKLDLSIPPTMRIAELETAGTELQKKDVREDWDKARISPENQRCVQLYDPRKREWFSTDAFESQIKELRKYNTGLVTVLLYNGRELECPYASSQR